jgi:16S rRNA (cytidine1402-2'-O)-methyltransferase
MAGTLWVVATPLGNLDDLSPRGRAALAGAALIACEDTRRTAKLLARFDIHVPMLALHKFSERERLDAALLALRHGGDVALVSDGGTPGISDPGALLVTAAHAEGIRVSPVPGPSAVVALLTCSGFPGERFLFDGFLPHRAGERRTRLRALAREPRSWIVYEAPHRVLDSLSDMTEVLGDRPIVLGRELTKVHETIVRGTARTVRAALAEGEVRGEIAIAVEGYDPAAAPDLSDASDSIADVWREAVALAAGDAREALRRAAKALGLKKPELRRRLVERGLIES